MQFMWRFEFRSILCFVGLEHILGMAFVTLYLIKMTMQNFNGLYSSFLGSTAQCGPWPPPQNPAELHWHLNLFVYLLGGWEHREEMLIAVTTVMPCDMSLAGTHCVQLWFNATSNSCAARIGLIFSHILLQWVNAYSALSICQCLSVYIYKTWQYCNL
jgi:hypothetical protein